MKQIVENGFSIGQVFYPFINNQSLWISNRCNLKCRFCACYGANANANPANQDMSFESARTAIEILSDSGSSLTITGMGEPLLNRDFISILSYAYQRFYRIFVQTNGVALNPKMVDEIINRNLDESKSLTFSFSVTGYSVDVYNKFQGYGQTSDKIRNTVYENINYFIRQRSLKKIPLDKLAICSSYILSIDENNYQDLKEYLDFWKNKFDIVNITTEHCFTPDFELRGYEYKIDQKAGFSCGAIHGKVITTENVGICCFANSNIGDRIERNSLREINTCHNKIKENFIRGRHPEFCRTCHMRNSHGYGFSSRAFKEMIDNLALIKDFFSGKKKVLFYGLNEYQRVLYTLIKGEGIMDRDNIVIIDPEAEGYFHNKRILRPTIGNLRGQDMIVFEEESFMNLDEKTINSLNSWVSYQDFI